MNKPILLHMWARSATRVQTLCICSFALFDHKCVWLVAGDNGGYVEIDWRQINDGGFLYVHAHLLHMLL